MRFDDQFNMIAKQARSQQRWAKAAMIGGAIYKLCWLGLIGVALYLAGRGMKTW